MILKKSTTQLLIFIILQISYLGYSSAQTQPLQDGSIYTIESVKSGKLISVENSSLNDGSKIVIWTDTQSDAQKWKLNKIDDNTFNLVNLASNLVITSNSGGTAQKSDFSSSIAKWLITDSGNNDNTFYIQLQPVQTYSLCIKETTAEGSPVQLSQLTTPEKWKFTIQEPSNSAPSTVATTESFDAWINTYYEPRGDNEVFINEGFWGNAEMLEIVDDAFEVTGNFDYILLFKDMYNEFVTREGTDWSWNEYNDDITWMCLACLRAYNFTGTASYLNVAKANFDMMYERAHTADELLGNGLIWKQGTRTKNACINGPAMIACCYLAKATGDNTYYDKAIELFEWSKGRLFDTNDGHVYDAYYVNETGEVNTNYWASTYNQGTYLGAVTMLYQYTKDTEYLKHANQIANFTRNMFNNSVINTESGNDLEGFKGIYMRYARKYLQEFNRADYIPWLQLNAKVAYNNRNSRGIIHTLWGTKTSETDLPKAFSASTAVSLLTNCPVSLKTEQDPYQTILPQDFDAIASSFMVDGPANDKSLQIRNNNWVGFHNLNFGTTGPSQIDLYIASGNNTGTIEIRLDNENGELIGTADITPTADYNTYQTISCDVNNIKGLHHIYLVYSGTGSSCYLNQFVFIKSTNPERGNGLLGEYYNGSSFNTLISERIDPNIYFNWGTASPLSGIDNDYYSIRWTGQIEPLYSGEYTFYITSDNGRRVWIDNQLIIDKWISDWDIEYSGKITLNAGQKYDIKVEYFEAVGGANIKLEWESLQQVKEIIPSSQLFLPEDNSTDIASFNKIEEIRIYPNPASEIINIKGNEAIHSVLITDMNGSMVYSNKNMDESSLQINVGNLSAGVYIVHLQTKNQLSQKIKFIKK
nr:glycoside hydrolase family 76 protein [uncultured Carboxylicivirga sp.]